MFLFIAAALTIVAFLTLVLTFHISMRASGTIDLRTWGKAMLDCLLFDRQPGAFVPIGGVYGQLLSISALVLYVLSFFITNGVSGGSSTLAAQVGCRIVGIFGFLASWVGMGYCLNACLVAYRSRSRWRLVWFSWVAFVAFLLLFLNAFVLRGKLLPFRELLRYFGG